MNRKLNAIILLLLLAGSLAWSQGRTARIKQGIFL